MEGVFLSLPCPLSYSTSVQKALSLRIGVELYWRVLRLVVCVEREGCPFIYSLGRSATLRRFPRSVTFNAGGTDLQKSVVNRHKKMGQWGLPGRSADLARGGRPTWPGPHWAWSSSGCFLGLWTCLNHVHCLILKPDSVVLGFWTKFFSPGKIRRLQSPRLVHVFPCFCMDCTYTS